jgi:hypothetical protein
MNAQTDYFSKLQKAAADVSAVLRGKGVAAERLAFGGEGVPPKRKPWVPPGANSNFLGNRAMGDWAESVLKDLIKTSFSEIEPRRIQTVSEYLGEDSFRLVGCMV